ncbi:hypothetical protein ISS07_00045 [Candidatus Woesearchaeota archaeon]|nr:hypothetical protein [Candidatus Woesearchaeota archaeon]
MKWKKCIMVILIIILVLLVLPIWCNTYYLPDQATQTAIKQTSCGPIWNMFQVY